MPSTVRLLLTPPYLSVLSPGVPLLHSRHPVRPEMHVLALRILHVSFSRRRVDLSRGRGGPWHLAVSFVYSPERWLSRGCCRLS